MHNYLSKVVSQRCASVYIIPTQLCPQRALQIYHTQGYTIIYLAADNGFNPIWNEICEFRVINPYFALLRFEVQDEDMFGEPNFIGQAIFPVSWVPWAYSMTKKTLNEYIHNWCRQQVNALRTGYRSVPLRNKYSEELELATLLVHISIRTQEQVSDAWSICLLWIRP